MIHVYMCSLMLYCAWPTCSCYCISLHVLWWSV